MERKVFFLFITVIYSLHIQAQQKITFAKAATNFLQTLTQEQSTKASFTFEDTERFNWHFVPKERNGLSLKEMNATQREAALNLLKATLSEQGYSKAYAIIQLEIILKEIEGRKSEDNYRDPTKYYFSIFGMPNNKKTWAWRIEGHHLALNFVSVQGKIVSATPLFMGSNRAMLSDDKDTTKMVHRKEAFLSFQLLNSLSETQLKKAFFSETAPPELFSGNSRRALLLNPPGISYTELDKKQQALLLRLLGEYVKNYPFDFASDFMKKIEAAGLDKLTFAWAGSRKWGAGHYYRIQNPVLLIEYENTQNNANHIHTVVRDLTNDFGDDVLSEHYRKEHK